MAVDSSPESHQSVKENARSDYEYRGEEIQLNIIVMLQQGLLHLGECALLDNCSCVCVGARMQSYGTKFIRRRPDSPILRLTI